MGIGTLVGALCQDTTTTTGTGAVTLANSVPAGAPAGSTTFAAQFAPGGSFQTAPGNTFYAIIDGSGNIELGLGTLTSATNLTRDYILGSYTGGLISLTTATQDNTHVNFAAGTKNVYSNASLFASSVAYWGRIPDDNAANIFQAVMSGTFTGVLTNSTSGTTNLTCRYKVTNEGMCFVQIPAGTVTGAGTGITITGIPAFLSNVTSGQYCFGAPVVVNNAANAAGTMSIAPGASPTATGTLSLYNGVSLAFTGAAAAGIPAGGTNVGWPLY